ncbi:MAG: hypothetical protein DRO11_06300 [Methanobacteriota archaeon]|nr:MAG: hypothetical protein DRO11_06300 [Euryarchaeota archaeon]
MVQEEDLPSKKIFFLLLFVSVLLVAISSLHYKGFCNVFVLDIGEKIGFAELLGKELHCVAKKLSFFGPLLLGVGLCVLQVRSKRKLLKLLAPGYGLLRLIISGITLFRWKIYDISFERLVMLKTPIIVFGLLLFIRFFTQPKAEYGFKPPKPKQTLLLCLLAALISLTVELTPHPQTGFSPGRIVHEYLIVTNLGLTLIIALSLYLFINFLEEAFFRGFLQGELKTYFRSIYPPVIITNLLFALWHPKGIHTFLYALIIGILLSWVREKTGSIFTCTFFHAIINFGPIETLLAYLCYID